MITKEQLAELASLARAATPGPWKTGKRRQVVGPYDVCVDTDIGPKVLLSGNSNFIADGERDAAFAAAANPVTVLALLARIAELDREVEEANEARREAQLAAQEAQTSRDSAVTQVRRELGARIAELEQDLVGAFVRIGELEYEVEAASEAPPILGAADLVAGNRYWARHGPNMKWALIDVSNVEGIEYGMKNWQFVGPVIPPAA